MADERQNDFLSALADVLEVKSVAPGDDYRETPLWGSLTCFAVKVMVAQRFGKDLSVRDISAAASAGALMERVFS